MPSLSPNQHVAEQWKEQFYSYYWNTSFFYNELSITQIVKKRFEKHADRDNVLPVTSVCLSVFMPVQC